MRIFQALRCQFALIDFNGYNSNQFTHYHVITEDLISWPNSDALNARKNLRLMIHHHHEDVPNA